MKATRSYSRFVSWFAAMALGFCVVAPGHAALTLSGGNTLQPGTLSFDLALSSDAADNVGFDFFRIDLSYLPAVQFVSAVSAVALGSLPAPIASTPPVPGWEVSSLSLVTQSLIVSYIADASATGLPVGQLLNFTFQVSDPGQAFTQQITATLTRFDLDDNPQGTALTAMTNVTAVPEPASSMLLAAGLVAVAGLIGARRRA